MKNNNKINVLETSAKSPKKKIVLASFYHSDMSSSYSIFNSELQKNKNIEELKNPNQYIGSNLPDKKPDIILIAGHGSNDPLQEDEKGVIHIVTVNNDTSTLKELNYATAYLVKEMAQKSKDDATVIIKSCYGGQSGINVLCNESLKDSQSAIILCGVNKMNISANRISKEIQAFSIIVEHEGKVSDKLINELKDSYSSTFSVIQNSQLTKYSRLKYDFDNKEFYREISVFDKTGANDEVWTKKRREYIENPNLDLLLGFVNGTFAEIKESDNGKEYSKEKIDKKAVELLKTLEVVIDRLQKDVSDTPDDDLVNELIVDQLIGFIINIYYENNAVLPDEFRYGLIDILCKKDYKGLSEQFSDHTKNVMDELIKKITSYEDTNLSPDLKTELVNKLNNFFTKNQIKFPSRTKESSLFGFLELGRISLYKSGLKFDYSKLSHASGLMNEGKYEEAIEFLIEIKKTSNVPDECQFKINNIIGYCFYSLEQYGKAETAFRDALECYEKLSQQNPAILNNTKLNLANTQFELNKFDEAKGTCEEIIKSVSNETIIKKAQKLLAKVNTKYIEQDSDKLNSSGIECVKNGNYAEAEKYFSEAIEFSENKTPEDKSRYHRNLASIKLALEKYTEAEDELEKSLEYKYDPRAAFNLIRTQTHLNKFNKAKENSIKLSTQQDVSKEIKKNNNKFLNKINKKLNLKNQKLKLFRYQKPKSSPSNANASQTKNNNQKKSVGN